MIDVQKLLGGLLSQSLGQGLRGAGRRGGRRARGRNSLGSLAGGLAGPVGLGVLGVAMAAFEHYTRREKPVSAPAAAPAVPPPPLAAQAGPGTRESDALLLVRAMVAAAAADGVVDQEEKKTIVSRLHAGGLTEEEKTFIAAELSSPPGLDEIVGKVGSRELAAQVYAVSLLALTVDTDAETRYLVRLRERLGLGEADVKRIEDELGLGPEPQSIGGRS